MLYWHYVALRYAQRPWRQELVRSGNDPAGWSNHPVDRLIQQAALARRLLTDNELQQIREHVATRALDERVVRVKRSIRDIPGTWQGRPFSALRTLSLAQIHLIERTILDQQWPPGTTLEQYVADLQDCVRSADQVFTFTRQGQAYMGFLAATTVQAPNAQSRTWVAYSASYGVIRTGYQVEEIGDVFYEGLPADWLQQR